MIEDGDSDGGTEELAQSGGSRMSPRASRQSGRGCRRGRLRPRGARMLGGAAAAACAGCARPLSSRRQPRTGPA